MNRIEIIKSAFDWDNPDRFTLWSDDFQLTDELGSPPMDQSSWFAMAHLLESSFPEMSEVIEDIREEGDGVVVASHFSGTFTNDLDLSAMGMGAIPATGKTIDFPTNTIQVSFDGDKISKIHSRDTGPDAGLPGFIKALGVAMG